MKKYEFTGETKVAFGVTLHRIRALVDIRAGVKAGAVGGWIENEKNLDQDGEAWVCGEAQVFGEALVFGEAQVFGEARVSDKAQVSGKAWVSDKAQVFGEALVFGEAWVFGEARVSDKARVFGEAWVFDKAQVSGEARVFGEAWVFDKAQVSDKARVFGEARVSDKAQVSGEARVFGEARVSCATSWMTCPEVGSFIGWKRAHKAIVKLQITDDAKRSSATSRKCRCSKAVVLGLENMDGTPYPDIQVSSQYDSSFTYRVGETVEVPDFDENRWNECSTGIHFFITRQEAVDY